MAGLLTLQQYREAREHVFRSESSAEWFVRRYQRKLVEAGALLVVCGRRMIDPQVADPLIVAIAREHAQKSELGVDVDAAAA